MKVLSLFDGMACGLQALKQAGIPITEYHAFEIDRYAIQIAKKNHPEIIHHGSVVGADFKQFKGFDLLIGGSPCQGFSFAGKQLAFDDPRSALFFEYVRALKEAQPRYFLLENVKMKQQHMDVISDMLGVQPVLINSALLSAQNRNRLYWCNWHVPQPGDKGITWGDVEQREVTAQNSEGWHEWFAKNAEFQLQKGYSKILSAPDKAITMTARQVASWNGNLVPASQIGVIQGRFCIDGVRQDSKMSVRGLREKYIEFRKDDKTPALLASQKNILAVPHKLDKRILLKDYPYRFITPIEAERLQTLPDNYTAGVSDSQRYRMLGNGWTVAVIEHILRCNEDWY